MHLLSGLYLQKAGPLYRCITSAQLTFIYRNGLVRWCSVWASFIGPKLICANPSYTIQIACTPHCGAHLGMRSTRWKGLDSPYLNAKFEAHQIILTPRCMAHEFNGFILKEKKNQSIQWSSPLKWVQTTNPWDWWLLGWVFPVCGPLELVIKWASHQVHTMWEVRT